MQNIITTDDGSNTLFFEEFSEHYHSTFGAVNESLVVYIENGLKYCKKESVNIFEMGFGTGLNAILSYIESLKSKQTVTYNAIELYPLNPEVISKLAYKNILSQSELSIFNEIHDSPWNTKIKLSDYFTLKKIQGDFESFVINEKYDLIYFDAFSPNTQPNLWSKEIFASLFNSLNSNGILTTYCSKGLVKNNLREAGFKVSRLQGPKGKRHVLRAEKINS